MKRRQIKRSIVISCCACLLAYAGFITICRETYNEHPDLSAKVVGSTDFKQQFLIFQYQGVQDACLDADLVVIGTVRTEGETVIRDFYTGEPVMKAKHQKAFDTNAAQTYEVSKSSVDVEEVLYGSCGKSIILTQNGAAGSDAGETKVKKGDRMLFILHKDPAGSDMWSSVSWEDGLFLLNDNGKVLSLTDNLSLAKYDERPVGLLKKDVRLALEYKKNGGLHSWYQKEN